MNKATLLFCGKKGCDEKCPVLYAQYENHQLVPLEEIEQIRKNYPLFFYTPFEEATSQQLNNCFTKSDFKNKQIKRFLDGK